MSVSIERFIVSFTMDLQDFYGFKPVYCDPWVTEKHSRQTAKYSNAE